MSSDFEQARAYFMLGVQHQEAGRLAEAERCYLRALVAMPGRPSTLLNLALTRLALGRPLEALEDARSILQADPAQADAWAVAARACEAAGRADEELQALEHLATLRPPGAALWHRRGLLLAQQGRVDDALRAFDAALALEPGHPGAWTQRGGLLRELGRLDEAAHCFRQAMANGGDAALNRWYLAAVTDGGTDGGTAASNGAVTAFDGAAQAPPAYVQALFDDYAEAFDAHLVGDLAYRGHEAVVGALPRDRRWAAALDLGCGTGLCGPLLRPRVQQMVGIDLSPRMQARARAHGVYDRLDEAEIVGWLKHNRERFDLVTAADVFIYIGDLAPVFAGVARVLAPGGDFVFSAEQPSPGRAVELHAQLRYAHGEAHLCALAVAAGLAVVAIERQTLRHEQRRAIEGMVCHLRRP